MPPVTRFVQICSKQEGYGIPGAIPTIRNNPMNLRHSPHSSHEGISPDDIGIIDTIEHGWEDAERQAHLWASRGLTLVGAIFTLTGWTPETGEVDGNDTLAYLAYVAKGLGVSINTPMIAVLLIPAINE